MELRRTTALTGLLILGSAGSALAQTPSEGARAISFVPAGSNPWTVCKDHFGVSPEDRYACAVSVQDLEGNPLDPSQVPAKSYASFSVPEYVKTGSGASASELEESRQRAPALNLEVINLKMQLTVARDTLALYKPFVDDLVENGIALSLESGFTLAPDLFGTTPIVPYDTPANPRSANNEQGLTVKVEEEADLRRQLASANGIILGLTVALVILVIGGLTATVHHYSLRNSGKK